MAARKARTQRKPGAKTGKKAKTRTEQAFIGEPIRGLNEKIERQLKKGRVKQAGLLHEKAAAHNPLVYSHHYLFAALHIYLKYPGFRKDAVRMAKALENVVKAEKKERGWRQIKKRYSVTGPRELRFAITIYKKLGRKKEVERLEAELSKYKSRQP